MKKRGVIITNAYLSTESSEYQSARISAELTARGADVVKVSNLKITAYTDFYGNAGSYIKADFAVYLDKDIHRALLLEKSGLRLFNPAAVIAVCDDKIKTHIALSGSGLKMPQTVSAPIMYNAQDGGENAAATFLNGVEKLVSYPMIIKEAHGSFGRQVYLAETRADAERIYGELRQRPHLYQQFIAESRGRDTRIIVIGGNAAAAMRRVSSTDFRSNIELGGIAEPYVPSAAETGAAETAARVLGADFCGIDILNGKGGEPIICEVNSNAFFRAIESVSGVNIAGLYADYILKKVYGT